MDQISISTDASEALVAAEPREPAQHTRRGFIRGIAAAGVSTAAVVGLERLGVLDLETDAAAQARPNTFSDFQAIAPSAEDVVQVPPGFRADVLIRYDDPFAGPAGELRYGYNNDFLAFFPLPAGSSRSDEGLIFVNHEYPAPFLQHGNSDPKTKTPAQVAIEQAGVGNAVVHIKRDAAGVWRVVSPSPYNRRVTAAGPELRFTGPLADNPAYPGIGATARGSLANCSGGITPWGTALSCEENYQDYAATAGFGYGWTKAVTGTDDYYNGDGTAATATAPGPDNQPASGNAASQAGPAKYGWVCEHDPYDASFQPRKHTALGRFRHENTAFRAQPGKPFVLYMGDDRTNGGVYKFVSDRRFVPGDREGNERILAEGQLFIARWAPEGRRRFDASGTLLTVPNGTGTWQPVLTEDLVNTHERIRARVGSAAFDLQYATNRPEDLEVDEDGTIYIALTNNSTVNDVHGSVRRVREFFNDATAVGDAKPFIWEDFAAGGPTGSSEPGQEGFSSPDNLVFDKGGNLWVVTDISSSALNVRENVKFHGNNAIFMVPRSGPNAGVAFRFANMPVQSEGTGPYFTPDEETLFVNVQHPGEESIFDSNSDPTRPESYDPSSYWPRGNKTAGQNPATPLPATVTISRVRVAESPGSPVIPPPATDGVSGAAGAGGAGGRDGSRPAVSLRSPARQSLADLRGGRAVFSIGVDEAATLDITVRGRLTSAVRGRGGETPAAGRGKLRRIARTQARTAGGAEVTVALRPSRAMRVLLRRERRLPAILHVVATDRSGNRTTRTKVLTFK